jgi:SAM-dependent methyltransferase
MSDDVKNKAMNAVWTPREVNVDLSVVTRWIYGISDSILWLRCLHWLKTTGLKKDFEAIELGCGYGKLSMALGLLGAKTTLLDYNQAALEEAVKAHRLVGLDPQSLTQDLLHIEAQYKNSFDFICSMGTLEHFFGEHRGLAFKAHVDMLKPGGILCFTVPNRQAFFYRITFFIRKMLGLYPKEFNENPFSRGELQRLASQFGVSVLEIGGVGTIKEDFNYWIGNNIRSAIRKIFSLKNDGHRDPKLIGLDKFDITKGASDNRTYFDKVFSYQLLFVGVKGGIEI